MEWSDIEILHIVDKKTTHLQNRQTDHNNTYNFYKLIILC